MEAPVIIREFSPIHGLRLFTSIPEGHRVVRVRQPAPGSIYGRGMYVVVDPSNTELVDGAEVACIMPGGPRDGFEPAATIRGLRKAFGGWCRAPGGFGVEHSGHLLDGPMRGPGLQSSIIGHVVGYLGDDAGQPLRDLWPDNHRDHPLNSKAHDLADLPQTYVCETEGECLDPIFKGGDKLQFSALDPVEPGDYVALWLNPEHYYVGLPHQVMVKRLVSVLPIGPFPLPRLPAPPVAIVEMDNPKTRFVVPLDRVMAVHKCRGVYGGMTYKVTRQEANALAASQKAAAGGAL